MEIKGYDPLDNSAMFAGRVTEKKYRATGPESTALLLPIKETVGGDVSVNKWTTVREWSYDYEGAPVRHRVTGPDRDMDLNGLHPQAATTV